MSIHADDEFSLRLALESELDDVTPRDGLADLVIARYRKGRRRRFAGVFGLFVVSAGIGVPIGVASASGGARPGPVALRLGSYTLTLPGQYHLSDPGTAPCAAQSAQEKVAAVSSRVCVLMFLTPPFSPRHADPNLPRGAKEVAVGRYRAWVVPGGYAPAGVRAALIVEGKRQDLVIGASGLSQPALTSLVSSGLAAA